MYKFDSDSFIRDLEEIYGVEDNDFDYDFDYEEYSQMNERDLKGDI